MSTSSPSIQKNSASYYLFNRSIEEIFPINSKRLSHDVLNRVLEKIIEINHYLISTKKALFLFSPTAFNNQCHLYALIMAQSHGRALPEAISENTPLPPFCAKLIHSYSRDERFLNLSLLLSFAFLTDSSLLGRIAEKAFGPLDKDLKRMLKDPEGELTRLARTHINTLFEEYLKKTFSENSDPLLRELALLSHEDLRIEASSGRERLYTFPKLAGVAYLINTLVKENLALIFRVKVISEEGTASFIHSTTERAKLSCDEGVIIFELVVAAGGLTFLQCRDIIKSCPTHSRRYPKRQDRHAEGASCYFCTDRRIDAAPFKIRFLPILERSHEMLYALGADFLMHDQKKFLSHFSNPKRYPMLSALFEKASGSIEKCSLSMSKPLNMSVLHVHCETTEMAFSEVFNMDNTYESHLRREATI